MAHAETTAERVRRHLAGRDDVVEKRMVGGLSFLVGGRLCCGVTADGLLVRVGADGVGPACGEPHVRSVQLGGRRLKAYVLVEPAGHAAEEDLARWLERALATVAGGD